MSFLLHDPMLRPLDDNGEPLPFCYMQFYQSQTTTPADVYDASGAKLENPVPSNAAGIFPAIYGDSAIVYRRQLYTAQDVLRLDTDPMHPHVAFPAGTLMQFDGTAEARDAAYPPALWELCDGDNGTPDTRDRGPVGVSNTKPIGSMGGSIGAVNTSSAGSHNHSGNTGDTTLDASNLPKHGHRLFAWNVNGSNNSPDGFGIPGFDVSVTGELAAGGAYITQNAHGTRLIEETGEDTGAAVAHHHTIGSDGSHTHTVPGAQSPYFTVWFLKRKP